MRDIRIERCMFVGIVLYCCKECGRLSNGINNQSRLSTIKCESVKEGRRRLYCDYEDEDEALTVVAMGWRWKR